MAWEARYGVPSRGNPLFERVPLAQHVADLWDVLFPAGVEDERGKLTTEDPVLAEIARCQREGRDPIAELYGSDCAERWAESGQRAEVIWSDDGE